MATLVYEELIAALRQSSREQPAKEPFEPPAPAVEPARGVCFHCGGTGRCNCIACQPPGDCLPCKVNRIQ